MLYTIAIYLYQLCVILVSPFHKKARTILKGQRETFRILRQQVDKQASYVWFHAASLGEFEQGRPLMERFRREHPEYKILLTFFSPSGYEVRKNYPGADIICYLPFDTPSNVYRFFHLVRPKMAFFIKYEFWADYMWACHHYHIPFYSVSSIFRPNKVFFRWYGHSYARVLRHVTHFFVQDEQSRELLAKRKILNNVTIVGDTRFDRVIDIARQAKELPLVEKFCKDAPIVFVAGSSWPPDEDLIIPYFNTHPGMKLILAPHVIDEGHLRQIEQKLKRPSLRYSVVAGEHPAASGDAHAVQQCTDVAQADCLIIDCYGLLSSIYRYGHVAYVGGGFGVGIHNVAEAAVYGVPVLIGPNNKNFREAQDLLRLGGCFEITGQTLFNAVVDRVSSDKVLREARGAVCKDYITSNAGASDVIFQTLGL
ncbi:MAG: 3-deoxy-D-manno-octulosonic acid transferase [Bacteroidaceae bacterium]|nr:3-deoxy-D-manno-octulosonic acid transferase [Bacteroidaceae bacterium]